MVVDLGRVRQRIDALRPQLDHRLLDEVPGLGHATLENHVPLSGKPWRRTLPGWRACASGARPWAIAAPWSAHECARLPGQPLVVS
jgi:6-pyruvoyl-tetrahydropterin synthase